MFAHPVAPMRVLGLREDRPVQGYPRAFRASKFQGYNVALYSGWLVSRQQGVGCGSDLHWGKHKVPKSFCSNVHNVCKSSSPYTIVFCASNYVWSVSYDVHDEVTLGVIL
jgi:hypothetical protein